MNRNAEQRKYVEAYRADDYRMRDSRFIDAMARLDEIPVKGRYLDIGCGRGEMLEYAASIGFNKPRGTEIVQSLIDGQKVCYAEAHSIPFKDKSFDVVSAFDVIEHLLYGDDEAMCKEMQRVAKSHILVTANNNPSKSWDGENLHINIRSYDEWDNLFREWFVGDVTWYKGKKSHPTEHWRIDL